MSNTQHGAVGWISIVNGPTAATPATAGASADDTRGGGENAAAGEAGAGASTIGSTRASSPDPDPRHMPRTMSSKATGMLTMRRRLPTSATRRSLAKCSDAAVSALFRDSPGRFSGKGFQERLQGLRWIGDRPRSRTHARTTAQRYPPEHGRCRSTQALRAPSSRFS